MLHVRHALINKSVSSSEKQHCEITTFYRFDDDVSIFYFLIFDFFLFNLTARTPS